MCLGGHYRGGSGLGCVRAVVGCLGSLRRLPRWRRAHQRGSCDGGLGTIHIEPQSDGGTTVDISVIDNCARTEVTAVDTTLVQPADILILVDSSPSMLEEVGFVRENLNDFSQQITDNGVDARVILFGEPIPEDVPEDERDTVTGVCIDPPLGSGSCPDDSSLPGYVHIPHPVASRDSLDVLVLLKDKWLPYIRPEALTAIVVISDDDAAYPRSLIGHVDDAEACASVDQGWYYDDPENPRSIAMCPRTCDTLQVVEVKEVEALFGCETKPAEIR